jgi:hypothetical protein
LTESIYTQWSHQMYLGGLVKPRQCQAIAWQYDMYCQPSFFGVEWAK